MVNAQLSEVESEVNSSSFDGGDMQFSGLFILEEIRKRAEMMLMESNSLAKPTGVKAIEKDTTSASEEIMAEVKKLLDKLNGKQEAQANVIATSRDECAKLNASYKEAISRLTRDIKRRKSWITSWDAQINENKRRRDRSIETVEKAMKDIRRVFRLRTNDRSVYRYNTAKRRRANNILNTAISLVCSLDDSKDEPLCRGVQKSETMSMELYGSTDAMAMFSREIANIKDAEVAKACLKTKTFLQARATNKAMVRGDNLFLLELLYKMKNKGDRAQARDTEQFVYNMEEYARQEADLVASVKREASLQAQLKAENERKEGYISKANMDIFNYFREQTNTEEALKANDEKCHMQEIDFGYEFTNLTKQIGIVLRLRSILRTMDTKGEIKCDTVKNCGGSKAGWCVFADYKGLEGMCVCRTTTYGRYCEHMRCPGAKEKLMATKEQAQWACSGRGTCDNTTGKCTCSEDQKGYRTIYHGPLQACERRGCPKLNDVECGGAGRSKLCHRFHGSCTCRPEFTGHNCYFKKCPMGCGFFSRGSCTKDGVCACRNNWKGDICNVKECEGGCGDATQGSCITTGKSAGKCGCRNGYYGSKCQKRECPDDCSGHGVCDITQGKCICKEGWTKLANCGKDEFRVNYGTVNIASGNVLNKPNSGNVLQGKYVKFSREMCEEPVLIVTAMGSESEVMNAQFYPDTFSVTTFNINSGGFWVNVGRVDDFNGYNKEGYKHKWGMDVILHYAAYCRFENNKLEQLGRQVVSTSSYTWQENKSNMTRQMIKLGINMGVNNLKWSMTPEYKGIRREVFALTHYGNDSDRTQVNVVKVSPCFEGATPAKFNIGRCGWRQTLVIHYYVANGGTEFTTDQHTKNNFPVQFFGQARLGNGYSYVKVGNNWQGGSFNNVRVLNNGCNYNKCERPDEVCISQWRDWAKCVYDKRTLCTLKNKADRTKYGAHCKKGTMKWRTYQKTVKYRATCHPDNTECWRHQNVYEEQSASICENWPDHVANKLIGSCSKTYCKKPSGTMDSCVKKTSASTAGRVEFPSNWKLLENCQNIVVRASIKNAGLYDDTFSHTIYGVTPRGFFVNFARVDNCHGSKTRGPFPCTGWGQNPYLDYQVTCAN